MVVISGGTLFAIAMVWWLFDVWRDRSNRQIEREANSRTPTEAQIRAEWIARGQRELAALRRIGAIR